VESVFDKITAWKKGHKGENRDSEQQEDFIKEQLKPKDNLNVHNITTARALLKGIQADMKLTDNELKVVLFTSLDQDYLTNMIIMQGEFMKWFTSNFAGDSGEEDDFKAKKVDAWESASTLALEIM